MKSSLSLFILLGLLLTGCTTTRTVTNYDPAKTHGVFFARPRACPDDRDILVTIDGRAVPFPDRQETLIVKVSEGLHTFVQEVGGYVQRRWVDQEIIKTSYYNLDCSYTLKDNQPAPPNR